MPIPLSQIPEHVRVSIVKKQNLHDFVRFQKSSLSSYSISSKIRTKFTLAAESWTIEERDQPFAMRRIEEYGHTEQISGFLEDAGIRFDVNSLYIQMPLSNELCERLTTFFTTSNSSSSELLTTDIQCSTNQFNKLLKVSKTRSYMHDAQVFPPEFLRVPALRNLEFLDINSLNDSGFVSLKIPHMNLYHTNISSDGLNLYLKQWVKGLRRIHDVKIATSEELHKHTIFNEIIHTNYTGDKYIIRRRDSEEISITIDFRGTVKIQGHF